ncbi:MAG: hypothetical protein KGH65_02375 [Candidatus Micrarchaeota archaeon]|nr:hypothetical protein [Candidatus Micrarchaeota archaeon]
MVVKLNELDGKHYLMLKSLESRQCMKALARPFKRAVADLQSHGLVEQAPGYIKGINHLSKDGREVLSIIRDSPAIKQRLEGAAKEIVAASEPKINAMMLRLTPKLTEQKLRSQGFVAADEITDNFFDGMI